MLFVLMVAEACAAAQSTSSVWTQRPLMRSHCLKRLVGGAGHKCVAAEVEGSDFGDVA